MQKEVVCYNGEEAIRALATAARFGLRWSGQNQEGLPDHAMRLIFNDDKPSRDTSTDA